MSAPSYSLAEVLRRSDVWRGDALANAPAEAEPSGFASLDAELPGRGWARGVLTELLAVDQGVGELSLLLPTLARLSQAGWLALIGPPYLPYAAAWAGAGVAVERLWVVSVTDAADAAWATEQVLASGAFAAVLSWLPKINAYALRRLQLAAEGQRSLAFIMRPVSSAASSSPAPLRIRLEPSRAHETNAAGTLSLRLIKRRGPPHNQTLVLSVPRPIDFHRLTKKRFKQLSWSRRQIAISSSLT